MGKLIKPGEEPTFYSDADDSDEEENEDKKTQWFSKSKIKKHSKTRFKSLEFSDPFHKNSFVISAAKSDFTTGLNSNGCSFLDLKVQSSKHKQTFWNWFGLCFKGPKLQFQWL